MHLWQMMDAWHVRRVISRECGKRAVVKQQQQSRQEEMPLFLSAHGRYGSGRIKSGVLLSMMSAYHGRVSMAGVGEGDERREHLDSSFGTLLLFSSLH